MVTYRNPGPIEFDTTIVRNGEVANSSAWALFPHDVVELFGVKGRVPVRAFFDGEPYRGSLVTMGGEGHRILVLREIQERISKAPGDAVHVRIELDDAPRTVELGEDVTATLQQAGLLEDFRKLSYSRQREQQLWIDSARRAETRAARIAKTVERLRGTGPTV